MTTTDPDRIGLFATMLLGTAMAGALWAAGAQALAFAGFVMAAIQREEREQTWAK